MQPRVVGTATRARAHRLGTFDVEWQCKGHCHSALSVQPRVVGTATRAWTYRFGTLDVEWQCKGHCHSALSVQSRAFTAEWQCIQC